MTVLLKAPAACEAFVPVAFVWSWMDVPTTQASARTVEVCVRCNRRMGEHSAYVVEHYSPAGPFMTRPSTVAQR